MARKSRIPKVRAKREPKLTVAECGYVLQLAGSQDTGNVAAWYLCDQTGRRMGKAQINTATCEEMLKKGELINGREDPLTGGTIYAYSPIIEAQEQPAE